jgi:hypothetical protein
VQFVNAEGITRWSRLSAGGQTVERGWESSVVDETPSAGAGFYCRLFIELAIGRAKGLRIRQANGRIAEPGGHE